MYAIVEIAGQQFKVQKDQKVYVHRLDAKEGDKINFDQVLLIGDGDKTTLGAPAIKGASISAKVEKHLKGDKVIVFKKKRRKGYKKKNGHRQSLTEITIADISLNGTKAKAAPKKAAAPKKEKAADVADDLSKIKGIGPVYAKQLAEIGFTTFDQIAKLTKAQIAKIADKIDGISEESITAEEWKAQAKELKK